MPADLVSDIALYAQVAVVSDAPLGRGCGIGGSTMGNIAIDVPAGGTTRKINELR